MKRILFVSLMGILLFSCNKNDNDNNDTNNPPAPAREWFKLKTIIGTTTDYNTYKDSTEIAIDSVNNKIIFKRYDSYPGYPLDSSIETYTYNSNYQLVSYERVTDYNELYISRMDFVRDANGQVTKVRSAYKNSLMATSEGHVTYAKRGDTTFVTFLDSAKKHLRDYYDGQEFYQMALVGQKLASETDFPIAQKQSDTSVFRYEYDGAGNLVSETDQYGKLSPTVFTYQRESQAPRELQKFIAQWTGDLFWFYRTKFLYPRGLIGYDGYIFGNALQSIKQNNAVYLSFTNTFDVNGNLTSMTYQPSRLANGLGTRTEQYKYRP